MVLCGQRRFSAALCSFQRACVGKGGVMHIKAYFSRVVRVKAVFS